MPSADKKPSWQTVPECPSVIPSTAGAQPWAEYTAILDQPGRLQFRALHPCLKSEAFLY